MTIAGFTAEASIYRTMHIYHGRRGTGAGGDVSTSGPIAGAGTVVPQFCVSSPCANVPGVGNRQVECCLDFGAWPPGASCTLNAC
jgi:hypothetical protein